MTSDLLRQWIGRTEHREDAITAASLAGRIAMLDRADNPASALVGFLLLCRLFSNGSTAVRQKLGLS